MSFNEYKEFIGKVSSEMYFSIMSLLHEQLPCSQNFFRLKKLYRAKMTNNFNNNRKSQSPARCIASPNMVRGLSSFKRAAAQAMESGSGSLSGGASIGNNTPNGYLGVGSPHNLNFTN